MQHTIAAVFSDHATAERASDELSNNGFSRSNIRLSDSDAAGTSAATTTGDDSSASSAGSSIRNFFSELFGEGHSDHHVYTEAVKRGHCVLTLTVNDEAEGDRASDIIDRFGPIDIDEHANQWRAGGWAAGNETMHSGLGAQQQSASMSQQSLQGTQTPAATGAQQVSGQGSMQYADTGNQTLRVIQEELKVGKRAVQRGGVRIYQHLVETPVHESVSLREEHVSVQRRPVNQQIDPADVEAFKDASFELRETAEEAVVEKSARIIEEVVVGKEVTQREQQIDDTVRSTKVEVEQLAPGMATGNVSAQDDTYYRTHWTSNLASQGGSYDDYAPAYRYGSSMAGSELYRGRPWDEIEPDIRRNWESSYPGSAWDKFKAAIRHGWDRITS